MKNRAIGWVFAFLACSCPDAKSQQLTSGDATIIQKRLDALSLSQEIRVYEIKNIAGRLQFQFELLNRTAAGVNTISAFYGPKKDRLLPKLFMIIADATGVGIDQIDGTGKIGLCTQTWSFPKSLSSDATVTVNTKLNRSIFLSRPEPTVIEVCESPNEGNDRPEIWGNRSYQGTYYMPYTYYQPDYQRFGGQLIIQPDADSDKKTYNYGAQLTETSKLNPLSGPRIFLHQVLSL
jgi:hypothetical protein